MEPLVAGQRASRRARGGRGGGQGAGRGRRSRSRSAARGARGRERPRREREEARKEGVRPRGPGAGRPRQEGSRAVGWAEEKRAPGGRRWLPRAKDPSGGGGSLRRGSPRSSRVGVSSRRLGRPRGPAPRPPRYVLISSSGFHGAPQDYDAAQVAAAGGGGLRGGDALLGEPDPEAGGVPGEAR